MSDDNNCCSDNLIQIDLPPDVTTVVTLGVDFDKVMNDPRPMVEVFGCTECGTVFLFEIGTMTDRPEGHKSAFHRDAKDDTGGFTVHIVQPIRRRIELALGDIEVSEVIYVDNEDT